jgi:diguanylate cyclase (GGDEF)-like protein
MLLHDTRSVMRLDHVTLSLIDRDHEMRRMLSEQGLETEQRPNLILLDGRHQLDKLFHFGRRPRLGAYDDAVHQAVFSAQERAPRSVALLPLVRNGELIGCLNFGSNDEFRFQEGLGTVFLEHLSAIVAACLKNSVNQERLKLTGLIDGLTGVNNRRFFDQRLTEMVSNASRRGDSLTCLFLDVDHFKQVNDNFDHQTGDRVLVAVASTIKQQLRASDVLARYGGEEFVVLLSRTSETEAQTIAERIREQVEAQRVVASAPRSVHVTISIGLCTLEADRKLGDAKSLSANLLVCADKSLMYAKQNGRNRVISASDLMLEATA